MHCDYRNSFSNEKRNPVYSNIHSTFHQRGIGPTGLTEILNDSINKLLIVLGLFDKPPNWVYLDFVTIVDNWFLGKSVLGSSNHNNSQRKNIAWKMDILVFVDIRFENKMSWM